MYFFIDTRLFPFYFLLFTPMSLPQTPEDRKKALTPEQYQVLRCSATEAPFTGKYRNNHENGTYTCAACGNVLFSSTTKFDSGTGRPSFRDVAQQGAVQVKDDDSHGMHRIEVVCANCGGHLGHLFDDGPADQTGKRYCINSAALSFAKKE